MVIRATLDGVVLAEADEAVSLEGNAYFPPESIRWEHLVETDVTSRCWWKGKASYFDAGVDGMTHRNVGWTYRTPSQAASDIADHVAFSSAIHIETTS